MPFETTTDDVIAGIDLRGSTAVITGATTGLGRETARALASAGARVVICGRSVEKCEASASVIRESVSGADLDTETFDLSDLTTVRAGAERILARYESLQLLVNNAGVMFTPEGRTAQGFETQFGTNHVGHFVLTNLLLPALQAGAPSRIVNPRVPVTGSATFPGTTPTTSGGPTTSSRPTGNPRRPTYFSRWNSIGAMAPRACGPTRFIRG